jgi:acyl CoA:acetate/3-ketoacid CoA transferase beta subunit
MREYGCAARPWQISEPSARVAWCVYREGRVHPACRGKDAPTRLTKKGELAIVEECPFPPTGARPANPIATEHATFPMDEGRLVLEEVAPDSSHEWVRSHTSGLFRNSPTLKAV